MAVKIADWLKMPELPPLKEEYFRENAAVGLYNYEDLKNLPLLKVTAPPPDSSKPLEEKKENPYQPLAQQLKPYADNSSFMPSPDMRNIVPLTTADLEARLSENDKVVPTGFIDALALQLARPSPQYMEAMVKASSTEKSLGKDPNPAAYGIGEVPKSYNSN
ncbi:hypothetical protein JXB11_05165 [Candidatus Woesearchaeota archaeon]|nr:hypothetical protein [Candidatus Woesearchaeota archaeon]